MNQSCCSRRSFLKICPPAAFLGTSFLQSSPASPSLSMAGSESGFLTDLGVVAPAEHYDLAIRSGYRFIEETVGRFLVPDKPEETFRANLDRARQTSLPFPAVNMFLPAELKSVGPSVNEDAILKWADIAFRRMQTAGIGIMVFGSGGSRRIPDGFDKAKAQQQFIQLNRRLGPVAQRYKVTIVLEPLNYGETNLLNTVEEGLAMAQEVRHPNVKLLADIFHMLRNGESPEGIIKAGSWLKHVHVAEKEKRTAPGVQGDDFRPYFRALRKIKYPGRLTIEAFQWGNREKEFPAALQELQKQIRSVQEES